MYDALAETWSLSASFSHLTVVASCLFWTVCPLPALAQLLRTEGSVPSQTAVWFSPLRRGMGERGGCGCVDALCQVQEVLVLIC